jgi:hypothetical protein
MKRRICSYDLAAVPDDGYVVTDDGGEIYLCNARCVCIWAVSLATKPGLSEELKARRLVLKVPAGEELVFESITGLALWASPLETCNRDFASAEIALARISEISVAQNPGGLNRSMQH